MKDQGVHCAESCKTLVLITSFGTSSVDACGYMWLLRV